LLYVFFEAWQLDSQRRLFESAFGLPVIEVEPHMPHHKHGVVKYDAGGLIVSLNLTDSNRFHRDTTDALVSDIDMPPNAFDELAAAEDEGFAIREGNEIVDAHGHHFACHARHGAEATRLTALRLLVDDLPSATRFYREVLDLDVRDADRSTTRFAAGDVDLVLQGRTPANDRQRRHDTYLIVFYTADIVDTQRQLIARGAPFQRQRPGYSEIGGSSRFADPSGNHLCLYQPSEECLAWGSGPKVMELAHIEGGANAGRLADRVSVPVRD
jgi:predicted enzyme related to lactoylglutathione lyase